MDRESFENWFHKHFVLEVWAFLEERELQQKAALLLDNAFSHPTESVLTSDDDLIVKVSPRQSKQRKENTTSTCVKL
jgi:hypothetical protein